MIKLISLAKKGLGIALMLVTSQAFAEYYVVRSTPPSVVVVCKNCQKPQVTHHKKYKKQCVTTHHRKHYVHKKPARSHYSISVYYPVVAASSCCVSRAAAPCSYCDPCSAGLCAQPAHQETLVDWRPSRERTYYISPTQVYFDESSLDYDRRTADDVGSDLNIDY